MNQAEWGAHLGEYVEAKTRTQERSQHVAPQVTRAAPMNPPAWPGPTGATCTFRLKQHL